MKPDSVCMGVCCELHGTCRLYHDVVLYPYARRIGTCLEQGKRPLYIPIKVVP